MSQEPDPNTYTAPFQVTKTIHRDVYSAVDPKNLSAAGKVAIVTGAGGNLGQSIAVAWSAAGAEGVILVGRNAESLQETAEALSGPFLIADGDVSIESDVQSIFDQTISKFGKVDVLINSASILQDVATGDISPSDWWSVININLKGTYNLSHYFINQTGGKGTVINLVSLAAGILRPCLSAYSISKLAQIRLGEYLHLEHPDLRIFSIHPGLVEKEGGRGMKLEGLAPYKKDKPQLTAGLTLYLLKAEADFLSGNYISVNWDVTELEAHREEITEKGLLKLGFLRAKTGPGGCDWSSA